MTVDASPPPPADIAVLLALRDGAATLGDQLASIAAQSHRGWRLIVSDDGSGDDGPAIAARFAETVPQAVEIRAGPGQGFARNFLSLIAAAGPGIPYAALADQDDVWLPEKLARGRAALAGAGAGPALYTAGAWIWDPARDTRRRAPRPARPPGFRNALIENIAPGNTILLNRAALDLAQAAAPMAMDIAYHDWWLYQLVTGAGGTVIVDGEPVLLYRQHGASVLGSGHRRGASARRGRRLLSGRFAADCARQLAALEAAGDLLTAENRAVLTRFQRARAGGPAARLAALAGLGLYRQSRAGTAGFWLAAALGRV